MLSPELAEKPRTEAISNRRRVVLPSTFFTCCVLDETPSSPGLRGSDKREIQQAVVDSIAMVRETPDNELPSEFTDTMRQVFVVRFPSQMPAYHA